MGDEKADTLDVDTVAQGPRSTVEPARTRDEQQRVHEALERLRDPNGPPRPRFHFGDVLAEGGTARVHQGTQLALDRKVAIKTLRRELRDDSHATLRLLREAWVTGAIEHPNVVPVYDLGLDADERPFIVMKRIQGVEWRSLMRDAARVEAQFGARDLLEWNLRVLMQACVAVHFAHTRGIVHRDLKPENIMIGELGEVYVVDWGIAVSVSDVADARFARASDAHEMAGTPCYMAPEMLGSMPSRISVRTDVYLLGALLYDVVCGRPPHGTGSILDVVRRISESKPDLAVDVPGELAAICRRAMSREPEARYESALELSRAITAFLGHRESTRLAERAAERLGELERELARPDATAQRLSVYRVFGECRFGFQQALAGWAENREARAGLERALRGMIRYELAAGEPQGAALLFAELEEKDDETRELLEAAARRELTEQQRVSELEALSRQHDPRGGARGRWILLLTLGTLWSINPLLNRVSPFRDVRGSITVGSLVFLFIVGVSAWIVRRSMMATAPNRRLLAAVFVVLLGQMAIDGGAALLGLTVGTARVFLLFAAWLITTMLAVTVDRRLIPAAVAYITGFFVAAARPEWVFYALSATNLTLTATLAWLWLPRAATAPSRAR